MRQASARQFSIAIVLLGAALFTTACTTTRQASAPQPLPRGGGIYKVGEPYQIAGVWYYPQEQPNYDETGIGSWYGAEFHGRVTANGEVFDRNGITGAHTTLPLPVNVRVTNLENGRSIVVRVNDRGPFMNGRIIDLSERAADLLGFRQQGTARVRVTYLGRADLDGGPPAEETPVEIATAVPAAPAGVVAETLLPPVAGVAQAAETPVRSLPQPATQTSVAAPETPAVGEVTQVPVPAQTSIYVQAGAYATADNALRVVSRLSPVGARMSQISVEGRPLYRVRIGPFQDVGQADAALAQVRSLGHNDVRLVVE